MQKLELLKLFFGTNSLKSVTEPYKATGMRDGGEGPSGMGPGGEGPGWFPLVWFGLSFEKWTRFSEPPAYPCNVL